LDELTFHAQKTCCNILLEQTLNNIAKSFTFKHTKTSNLPDQNKPYNETLILKPQTYSFKTSVT